MHTRVLYINYKKNCQSVRMKIGNKVGMRTTSVAKIVRQSSWSGERLVSCISVDSGY